MFQELSVHLQHVDWCASGTVTATWQVVSDNKMTFSQMQTTNSMQVRNTDKCQGDEADVALISS
jgi:hypothetical protein